MCKPDELWQGGPVFRQDGGVFKIGTDSVLLTDFAKTARVKRVCDLGCGSAVLAILLALKSPAVTVDGFDITPEAVRLARENVELNALGERVSIVEGDIRCFKELMRAGEYDLIIANPPYYPAGSGKIPGSQDRAAARSEESLGMMELFAAAAYACRWGGSFALVHKPERLGGIFALLDEAGFAPKRLRMIQNRPDSAPSLVLVESRRGGSHGLSIEPPLILTGADGEASEEIRRICHR